MIISDFGLSVEVPSGWYGRLFQIVEPLVSPPTLHIASIPLAERPDHESSYASATRSRLGPDDTVIAMINWSQAPRGNFGSVKVAELGAGDRVEVRPDDFGIPAYTIPADHPAIRAASAALTDVYPDREVLLAVISGTLPAATLFEEVLGAKTLFFSFSTADENLHAPNEFLRVARLGEGMRAWERLWRLLADL
jgi:hypothetical protein